MKRQRLHSQSRHAGIYFTICLVMSFFVLTCGTKEPQYRAQLNTQARNLLQESREAFRQKQYSRALQMADSAWEIEPESPEVHFVRGLIFDRRNQLEQSREAYQAVIARDPGYPGVWFNLGNVWYRQRQYEDAARDYQRALRYYKEGEVPFTKSDIFLNLGLAYNHLGKSDSALVAFQAVVRLDSTDASAYMLIARKYEEDGEPEKALQYGLHALRLDPENLNYHYTVGSLFYQTGDLQRSQQHLSMVLARRPWDYRAQQTMGQIYLRQGDIETGKRYLVTADTLRGHLSKIVTLQQEALDTPDNLMLWANLGREQQTIGNYQKAKEALEKALALDPDNIPLQNNLAYLALQVGDTADAITRFRTLLSQDSTLTGVWSNLALTLEKTGDVVQASHAWRQVLKFHPEDSLARARLKGKTPGRQIN